MSRGLIIALLCTLLCSLTVLSWRDIDGKPSHDEYARVGQEFVIDLGVVPKKRELLIPIKLQNSSSSDVGLIEGTASCGCISFVELPTSLKAGEVREATLSYRPSNQSGPHTFLAIVRPSAGDAASQSTYWRLQIKSIVEGLWIDPPYVDFGSVRLEPVNGKKASQEVAVFRAGSEQFCATKLLATSDDSALRTMISSQGSVTPEHNAFTSVATLSLELSSNASIGRHTSHVSLNREDLSEVAEGPGIRASYNVTGSVSCTPPEISALLAPDQRLNRVVILEGDECSSDVGEFSIESSEEDGITATMSDGKDGQKVLSIFIDARTELNKTQTKTQVTVLHNGVAVCQIPIFIVVLPHDLDN